MQLSASVSEDNPGWVEVRPLMVPGSLPVLPG